MIENKEIRHDEHGEGGESAMINLGHEEVKIPENMEESKTQQNPEVS